MRGLGRLLEKPLEVVRGQPRLMLVAACSGWDACHARATRLPSIVVGNPLKALLAPLFDALDGLPAIVDGNIGWCSLTTAQGRLPASLGPVKHNHLVAGGDVVRCLKCVPAKVSMLTLERPL
jgi:hypothetical protein